MITAMAHVCFIVKDLERSLEFYRDLLGLTPAFDFRDEQGRRHGAYLKVGGRCFIELFQKSGDAPDPVASSRHICLEVDDLDATVQALRERGLKVTDKVLGCDQTWQAWLNDPDGNPIELFHYTPESWQARWLD